MPCQATTPPAPAPAPAAKAGRRFLFFSFPVMATYPLVQIPSLSSIPGWTTSTSQQWGWMNPQNTNWRLSPCNVLFLPKPRSWTERAHQIQHLGPQQLLAPTHPRIHARTPARPPATRTRTRTRGTMSKSSSSVQKKQWLGPGCWGFESRGLSCGPWGRMFALGFLAPVKGWRPRGPNC